MPWTTENPPPPAKNWPEGDRRICTIAANKVLREGGSEQDAIFACISAAGRSDKMARSIQNVEIFKVGTWFASGKKMKITGDNLDEMVASFEALNTKPGFIPALKLGHSAMQKFFGNNQGAPRLGFVEKIWRAGDKILANFSDVPDVLVDLIEKGRYNQVSVEVFPKYEFEGKVFKNLLTAVALLGAELPAVKGLKDLASSLFVAEEFDSEQARIEYTEEDQMEKFTQEQVDALTEAAIAKAIKEAETKFTEDTADLNTRLAAQDEEIKGLREDKEKAAEDAAKFAETQRTSQLKALFDQGVKDGKFLPKQEESVMAMAAGLAKFNENGKTEIQLFEEYIKNLPKAVDFKEHLEGTGDDKDGGTAGEQVHAKTVEVMSKDAKMEYSAARQIVLSADPDLKKRYTENPNE